MSQQPENVSILKKFLVKLKTRKALRKRKKLLRAKARAQFQSSHPYLMWSVRLITFSVILLASGYVYKTFYELYENYTDSRKWEKVSTTPLASIDVETLYASEKEKKSRIEYLRLRTEIWDESKYDFKAGATLENVNSMVKAYDSIKSSKESLEEIHDEIMTMWEAKQLMDSIFVDKTSRDTITLSMSTSKMSETLSKSFDLLSQYLIHSNRTAAHRYHDEILKLIPDLEIVNQLMIRFNEMFSYELKNGSYKFKTLSDRQQLSDLQIQATSTVYKWEFINNLVLTVITKSEPIAAANEVDADAYQAYLDDKAAQETFKSFITEYENKLKSLKADVIDLPNYEGEQLESVKADAMEKGINLEWEFEETTTRAKDQVVKKQNVLPTSYKKILKGSLLKLTVYEYREPVVETTTQTTQSQQNPRVNSGTSQPSTNSDREPAASIGTTNPSDRD